ncbi:MAG: hypothetical protein OXN17_03175 [Candidatus Poribacteria bacterium]|nr:hypothetical protein [Candidatus Poribacteria bacterium]MDE0504248.1 hypothetical protein [Candidatus Poribacteria bacterium]
MNKLTQPAAGIISLLLVSTIFGCSALQTVQIVPQFDAEAVILPQTGTVIYEKNGITAIAVPLNDVKAVDAFGILMFNQTGNWISFKAKDCQLLDQAGNITKPIDKSQESFYLGKNFKPKMPPEFTMELFRHDSTLRAAGSSVALPREDIERTTIMPNHRTQFFLYFRKRSIKSTSLRVIVPKVSNDFEDTETTFVFKFEVVKGSLK